MMVQSMNEDEMRLIKLCFVLPSGQGNVEITCYSCTAATDRSMSLILDIDLCFPDFLTAGSQMAIDCMFQADKDDMHTHTPRRAVTNTHIVTGILCS